ncbi:TPA: phosphomannomutase, partial [Escherichia coli]
IVDLLGENEAGIEVKDINNLDGYRFTLNNNVIIHLRSSGNAPELRCYCEADSEFCAQKYVERILSSVACLIKIN